MAYTRNHARPLLTDAEYELFTASLADRVGGLDAAGLRKAIGRTRKFRDKARDTHRRQSVAVRRRAGARGAARTANERTAKKQAMLAQAIGRFEKRLAQLESAEQRPRRAKTPATIRPRPTPARGGNRATRRSTAKGRRAGEGRFMSSSAQAEATNALRAPQTRINASRAAAGRRGQAKRDHR